MNGETGQDIVDAAMLQLQEEGYVHNRARLIASSYLSKTLKIDWRHGLNHYDSLLSDADFSSNAGNWQWMAGTGTDTRPNRVLSPKRQAERFDPNGSYRKRYLSESRSSIQSPGEQRLF
jgi:deoxyribodipyrimidine photo-lyase